MNKVTSEGLDTAPMEKLFVLFLTLLGAFNRLQFLNTVPMRYDEAYTFLTYASKPLGVVLTYYDTPNNHVFHSLLVHISVRILGDVPLAIRLPAFIAGVLLTPATYAVGTRFYNRQVGLLAASFVSASSILIEYSVNARGYMLICLFFLLLLRLAARLVSGDKVWLPFAIVSSIGFYTIPTMLFAFGIVILWLSLEVGRKRMARTEKTSWFARLSGTSLVVFILTSELYFPVFVVSGLKSLTSNQFVRPLDFLQFASRLPESLVDVATLWLRDTPLLLVVAAILGFAISIRCHRQMSRYRTSLTSATLVASIPILLALRVVPYARVWLFLLPVLLMAAASGICWGFERLAQHNYSKYRFLILGSAVAIPVYMSLTVMGQDSILHSRETGTLPDAEQIAAFIRDYPTPTEGAVVAPPSLYPLHYYFKKLGVPSSKLHQNASNLSGDYPILVVVNTANEQTLEHVLRRTKLSDGFSLKSVQRVQSYESAELYLLQLTR